MRLASVGRLSDFRVLTILANDGLPELIGQCAVKLPELGMGRTDGILLKPQRYAAEGFPGRPRWSSFDVVGKHPRFAVLWTYVHNAASDLQAAPLLVFR